MTESHKYTQSYEVWDSNQARQFKSALEKYHKDMWKSWKKAADNKPHKVRTSRSSLPTTRECEIHVYCRLDHMYHIKAARCVSSVAKRCLVHTSEPAHAYGARTHDFNHVLKLTRAFLSFWFTMCVFKRSFMSCRTCVHACA